MTQQDKNKFPESRLHPRVIFDAKISSIKVSEKMRDSVNLIKEEFSGQAIDISLGGIGIYSEYYLPTGLLLELKIDGSVLGIQRQLEIKAEVRYCNFITQRKYRCGLKFVDLSKEDKAILAEFVKNAEKRKCPRIKLYPDE